jgi:hypothetical protein
VSGGGARDDMVGKFKRESEREREGEEREKD